MKSHGKLRHRWEDIKMEPPYELDRTGSRYDLVVWLHNDGIRFSDFILRRHFPIS